MSTPVDRAAPTTFERERRVLLDRFALYGDRKAKAFVMLESGLSHGSGHIQYLMSVEEARELGEQLVALADFASVPMLGST